MFPCLFEIACFHICWCLSSWPLPHFFQKMTKKRIRFFLLSPRERAREVSEPRGVELLFSFPSPPRRLHDFGGVGCGTRQCLMAARPTLRGTGGGLLLLWVGLSGPRLHGITGTLTMASLVLTLIKSPPFFLRTLCSLHQANIYQHYVEKLITLCPKTYSLTTPRYFMAVRCVIKARLLYQSICISPRLWHGWMQSTSISCAQRRTRFPHGRVQAQLFVQTDRGICITFSFSLCLLSIILQEQCSAGRFLLRR